MSNIFANILSSLSSNIKVLNKLGSSVFWFVYCLFYDFWNLSLSNLDKDRKDLKNSNQNIYYNYSNLKFKLKILNFFKNETFLNYDILWLKILSFNYLLKTQKTLYTDLILGF